MFRGKLKKVVPYLVVILIYGIFGVVSYNNYFFKQGDYYDDAGSLILKYGSKGATVTEAQKRLKDWGYYTGSVDGVYGWRTVLAVRSFQQKNGIRVDGVIGSATAAALGININTPAASSTANARQNEVYTLAQCIHGEARGEPYTGQVAVGAVILNRVDDSRFPKSIAGVIYQPGAFTAVSDGQMFLAPGASALKAAQDALNGWDPSGGALYYYNPAKTTNKWIWSRPIIKVIGKHYFCK